MQTGIFCISQSDLLKIIIFNKNSNILRTIYIMIKLKIQNVSKYDTK